MYGAVIYLSFHDAIYCFELNTSSSQSLIETGTLQLPAWRAAVCLIIGMVLLELYCCGYRLVIEINLNAKTLFFCGAGSVFLCFLAAPFDSTDVSVYINQGWLQVHYGLNPYAIAVNELQGWSSDPMLRQHWTQYPCSYGALFTLLCAGLSYVAHGQYLLNVYLFKAVNAVVHLCLALLIYAYLHKEDRRYALASSYLYLFSPFALLHFVSNGHNDLLLAFFTVCAFIIAQQKKYWLVPLLCCLGAAVKFVSLILLPGFLVLTWKQSGVKSFIAAFLLASLFSVAMATYFFRGLDPRHIELIMQNTTRHYGSFQSLLKMLPEPGFAQAYNWCALLGFGVIWCIAVVSWIRIQDANLLTKRVLHDSVLLMTFLICVLSRHFNAWYVEMFFPLALMLPADSKLRRFALFSACTMVFSFTWFGFPNPFYAPLYLWAAWMMARLPLPNYTDSPIPAQPSLLSSSVSAMFGVPVPNEIACVRQKWWRFGF